MIKMERAQLAKPIEKVPELAPAKDAEPSMLPSIMALTEQVQAIAQIVAQSAQQNTAAIEQMAAIEKQRPTGMEAKVRRDADGKMTRVLVEFTY